jgi:hypothetical protein
MFSLLRRVRHNLLKTNSFGTYFLYATGEVLLIVLGILIALWVDNWNSERLEKEREQFYLAELESEFRSSRAKLVNLIQANEQSYHRAREIADVMARAGKGLDEAGFSRLLFRAFSDEIVYNPNTSVLEELINSGRLEYLSNKDLRGHLTSWSSRMLQVKRQEENLRKQRNEVLELTLQEGGNIRGVLQNTGILSREMGLQKMDSPPSNLRLLQSQALENHLLIFILTGIATEKNHYQPLLDEIDTILGFIASSREQAN